MCGGWRANSIFLCLIVEILIGIRAINWESCATSGHEGATLTVWGAISGVWGATLGNWGATPIFFQLITLFKIFFCAQLIEMWYSISVKSPLKSLGMPDFYKFNLVYSATKDASPLQIHIRNLWPLDFFLFLHWLHTNKKSARRSPSGVGTGERCGDIENTTNSRNVEGAWSDATSIRRSNVVMLFITSWLDLWLEHLAPETGQNEPMLTYRRKKIEIC